MKIIKAIRHCSLFAPLLLILTDEFLILISTIDSSYNVGTNLARSLPISNLKKYVAGGQLYGDVMIVNIALTLVFNTGLFPDACRA
jgi:hypothetical protein